MMCRVRKRVFCKCRKQHRKTKGRLKRWRAWWQAGWRAKGRTKCHRELCSPGTRGRCSHLALTSPSSPIETLKHTQRINERIVSGHLIHTGRFIHCGDSLKNKQWVQNALSSVWFTAFSKTATQHHQTLQK